MGSPAGSVAIFLLLLLLCLVAGAPVAEAGRERFDFVAQGIQVGESVADATVYTLEGTPRRLSEFWADQPMLLVTASLTCPVARQRSPAVEQLAQRFGDQVSVVMLYTIEAHPKGDPSPYAEGNEWLTPQNQKEGILCRQPRTLEERLQRAKEFQHRLGVSVPVVIDGMDNGAWQTLGSGPNMGLLIRPDGVLAAKHGWFDGKAMLRSIQTLLTDGD